MAVGAAFAVLTAGSHFVGAMKPPPTVRGAVLRTGERVPQGKAGDPSCDAELTIVPAELPRKVNR